MKIGLSTSSIERERNHGVLDGMGHYTIQLMKNLKSMNHEVEGFAFPRVFKKINFQNSSSFPKSFPEHMLWSYFQFKMPYDLGSDVDIFHCTDYKMIPVTCPVVATIWDAIPFVHPEWFPGYLRSRISSIFLKRSAEYANRVIAVSEHAAKDLVKYFGICEDRIEIIPWCISDKWLSKYSQGEIESVCSRYNISTDYILTVGTLQPRKNFGRVIDAFVALPDKLRTNLKLLIVGKYGWMSEDLVKKIHAYTNSGDVLWLKNVENDCDLQSLYQGARAFVFPSLYEGFGMPVLEAFASGVPVITSNTTSIPEVCGDAALQVDPSSTKQITDAIDFILKDGAASRDFVKNGYKRLKLFNEYDMMAKIVGLYKKLL